MMTRFNPGDEVYWVLFKWTPQPRPVIARGIITRIELQHEYDDINKLNDIFLTTNYIVYSETDGHCLIQENNNETNNFISYEYDDVYNALLSWLENNYGMVKNSERII